MNGYVPQSALIFVEIFALLAALLLIGFAITRLRTLPLARAASWLLAIVGGVATERLTAGQPAGLRMLALIGALLLPMKTLVCVEAQGDGKPRLSWWKWLAFSTLWLGMRPAIFADLGTRSLDGAGRLMGKGVLRLAIGAALMIAARIFWPGDFQTSLSLQLVLVNALLLVGISFALHFGLLNILAGAWRKAGVDCRPLFRAPIYSKSLSEFWSRRWNLGFSEMTSFGVYRPLRSLTGKRVATFAAFLYSGLLHEWGISIPVMAGFGLPLLYFQLHGMAMIVENRLAHYGRPIHHSPFWGRVWTAAWLIIPVPILFHPPFLRGCVWPLIGIVVE